MGIKVNYLTKSEDVIEQEDDGIWRTLG